MCKVLLFGGTTEGRQLSEFLVRNSIAALCCSATEYGGSLTASSEQVRVLSERLRAAEMEDLMRTEQPEIVIDATHPYAAEVTENIRQAAEVSGIEYLRVLRESTEKSMKAEKADASENAPVYMDSLETAIHWLNSRDGNILATTGSKQLQSYTAISDWQNRVYARVLSTAESVLHCCDLGFEGKHLIAMQGPFSTEMNAALIRALQISYLVTKDTGKSGGYAEKLLACEETGCTPVIIGRPRREKGVSVSACKQILIERFSLKPKVHIRLIGIGPGSSGSMTEEAANALKTADCVIGSGRMLDWVRGEKPVLDAYRSDEIAAYIDSHREYENFAVLLSGDTGFYSGAKKLYERLCLLGESAEIHVIPGISSVSTLAARLGTSWDDAAIVSNHGRQTALIPLIRDHAKVFSILGKPDDVAELAKKLVAYALDDVRISVGERLSYEDERITTGNASDFITFRHDPLSVVMIENPYAKDTRINSMTCRRDEAFIRGKVPMTKEEIRVLSIDRLQLTEDAVCYDIGAGTGSVSVEMALRAAKGSVYAVERNPEAISLLTENKRKFRADNLHIIEGLAPEAMEGLPPATHVFIGGSAGNMEAIIQAALTGPGSRENEDENVDGGRVRFVINCIAMESSYQALACAKKYGMQEPEITQISVARGHAVGNYTMMKSENPITIICFEGKRI